MKKLQITTRVTPRDSKSMEVYLHEISKIPLLTIEEEVELARRIHDGDEQALNRLVTSNLRFVVSVSKNFLGNGLALIDLISAGNIGLIKAAKRFDETYGIKFCSYAVWWIRQAITDALNKEGHIVTMPANKLALLSKISKERSRMEQQLQYTPSINEVTDSLGEDGLQVSGLICTAERPVSLDAPLQGEEDLTRMDTMADTSSAKTDEGLMQESLRLEIESVLSALPNHEREVVRMSYGFNQPHPYTIGEIALQMRLSNERVRQLHVRALKRLRNMNNERLRSYL